MKRTISFLAGMLAAVVLMWYADGRASIGSFAIGGVFTIGSLAAAGLSSPARLIRTARLLDRIGRRASPRKPTAPTQSAIEAEIASALKNFGAEKAAADHAARRALERNPSGSFKQLFPVAVQFAKGKV